MNLRDIPQMIVVGGMATVMGLMTATANAGAVSRSVSRHTLNPNAIQTFDQGQITAGHVLFGITTPIGGLPANFDAPDTVVGTFFTGNVGPTTWLTRNDDSDADTNPPLADDAFSSLFRLAAPTTTQYTVAVTGTGNNFNSAPPQRTRRLLPHHRANRPKLARRGFRGHRRHQ